MDDEQPKGPSYYAILIGIDAYVDRPLRGCVCDIQHIKELLEQQPIPIDIHAFTATSNPHKGPHLMEDSKFWPTYANVTRAMRETTFRTQTGDHVYIHYSGHRTRWTPDSEFLNHSAGNLALALVGGENGDIEEPLGGHRLTRALNAMVQKGLVLTVVLDCCFAASFYRRGHTNVRFTPPSTYFASNSPIKTSGTDPDDEPLVSRFRDVPMLPSWMMNPNGYAVLAACGPREEATEIIQDGNHHDWASDTKTSITASAPGFERAPSNRTLRFVQTGNHLILQAGRAHGVAEGDEFILYPSREASQTAGSQNNTMVATATQIQPLTSTLALEQALTSPNQEYLVAEPQTRRHLQDHVVTIDPDIVNRDVGLSAISERSLSDHDSTDSRYLSFSVMSIDGEYKISGSPGQEVRHLPIMRQDSTSLDDISAVLAHLAKYEFVKNISNSFTADDFRSSINLNITTRLGNSFDLGNPIEIQQDGSMGYMFELKIKSILRGSFETLPPVGQSRGFSGRFSKKLRTAVPNEIRDRGFRTCDDVLKVLVTSQPTSFDLFELPKIGQVGKKRSSTRNGKTEDNVAQ
ncbi:hypothetical protein MRS44_005603 [Fusarium solani]|uniref:uncharacterized protein n=1 Tax=Fusarium solani TaxID=169388 RepID=UPI0032C44892|nr:hypothetical protein MRS44_005603 [Fusarium solani]